MSIVFDNIVFSLQRVGGISRFWSRIIEPYLGDPSCLFIDDSGGNQNVFRSRIQVAPVAKDHLAPRKIARFLNFNRQFFDGKYVFHSSYFRVNNSPGCRNVTTVHDLIYEDFGSGIGTALNLHQKKKALQSSSTIVCLSENTRKDLYKHYPFCQEKPVVVIPNGVEGFHPSEFDQHLFSRLEIQEPRSYFLYVGHRGACKGFDRIHDVIDLLKGEFKCVVVGGPFDSKELTRIAERKHSQKIIHAGKVSDAELNSLYGHARFFFFPSLYEGFGLPPLEAMQAGCPVLASNRSSIPEVVGDAGILFDPDDIETLRTGLSAILDEDVARRLIESGLDRASRFGWKPVIDAYASLYRQLLDV